MTVFILFFLEFDYWYRLNDFIAPYLNQISICHPRRSCHVQAIRVPHTIDYLFVMHRVEVFRKREDTFFAAVSEIEEDKGPNRWKSYPHVSSRS